jgi:hypothetical protein
MNIPGRETLGAALAAQDALHPADEATRRRLAEMVVGVPEIASTSPPVHRAPVPQVSTAEPSSPSPDSLGRRLWTGLARLTEPVVDAVLSLGAQAGATWRDRDTPVPSELSTPTALEPAGAAGNILDPPRSAAELAVDPLLVPRWTAGILTAAVSLPRMTGLVEVRRLVDQVARLRPPTRLPRQARRSITGGVLVLVDMSEDMGPFRQDLLGILRDLRRVIGSEHVTVLRFAGRPLTQIGAGQRDTWKRFEPPEVPRPVLVLSNFRRSAAPFAEDTDDFDREMMMLVDTLDQFGCPAVALVPNSAGSVPEALRSVVRVIEWDRTTTAATASRAVQR